MYNPKGTKLSDIKAADINKKAIAKLAKKATDEASALPFFIKTDFEYANKQTAPLFIFGKLKAFKKETKELKGATEQHGFAFVQTDEKGKFSLCLIPTRGKLASKATELKKASKAVFGSSVEVQIFAPIPETEIAAREAAAESKADALIDEPEEVSPTNSAKPSSESNLLEQMAAAAKQQLLAFSKDKNPKTVPNLLGTLSDFMEAAKTQTDKITTPIAEFLGKAQSAYQTLSAQTEPAPLAPKAQRKASLAKLKSLAAQISALNQKPN